MHRITLTAFLVATAAHAQEPPTAITVGPKPVHGTFDEAGDLDRYTVRLTKGQDYAVTLYTHFGSFKMTLREPSGRVLGERGANYEVDEGFEVRARGTGAHMLEVLERGVQDWGQPPYPSPYEIRVITDCRGAKTSLSKIRPGVTQQRHFAYAFDAAFGSKLT